MQIIFRKRINNSNIYSGNGSHSTHSTDARLDAHLGRAQPHCRLIGMAEAAQAALAAQAAEARRGP